MFYTIYKITNKINNKIYIGCHQTDNLEDGYMGSGKAIKNAIKKYGKENFNKEIIEYCKNKDEMFKKEKEYVFINEKSYNLMEGGNGGFSHIKNPGKHMKTLEMRKKFSEINKKIRNGENKEYYDKISINNLKNAIKNNTGKKRPNHSVLMKNIQKEKWKNNKEELRNNLSSTFKIISPSGEEFITNRLTDFCIDKNLSYKSLLFSSKKNKFILKGKSKNWKAEIITKRGRYKNESE